MTDRNRSRNRNSGKSDNSSRPGGHSSSNSVNSSRPGGHSSSNSFNSSRPGRRSSLNNSSSSRTSPSPAAAPVLKPAGIRSLKYEADLIVIGAGAAGMAAAICGAESGASVICVDKNESAGKKIRATGNGRCNISNTRAEHSEEVLGFLRENGILTRTFEGSPLVYPCSESAADVAEALEARCLARGCMMLTEHEVTTVTRGENGFAVSGRTASGERFSAYAHKLIIAAGGKAGPAFGTTGDAYKWLRELGHTVIGAIPVLTPVECEGTESLAGIRTKAEVVLYRNGTEVFAECGEVQFTKFGLSGICIFNATRHMRYDRKEGISTFEIGVRLADEKLGIIEFVEERLTAERADSSSVHQCPAYTVLRTAIKDKLAKYVFKQAGVSLDKTAADLTSQEIRAILDAITELRFRPTGVRGWKEAQCTSGGVSMEEINMETYESKLVPGLYITGELLDYDGPCGGYNLNHAFWSGMRAGIDAGR